MIIKSFPPNIEQIQSFFTTPPTAIFAYSPFIYSPLTTNLPTHLLKHEQVHLNQQNTNPEEWWNRYLTDKDFRLSQEVEAYQTQYRYLKRNIKNLQKLDYELDFLVSDLSSPMYGSIISPAVARNLITNGI